MLKATMNTGNWGRHTLDDELWIVHFWVHDFQVLGDEARTRTAER
jgi:dTDP-4-dehydrorhamnose 3,5-epimerase-like enzyme